jgi:hypothetical protein
VSFILTLGQNGVATENVPPSFEHEPTRKQKKINRCNPLITKGKWTNEALEEAMDAIENGTISLRKASRHWNVPLTSLFEHLYGKTKSKKPRLVGMLIIEENQVVVAWVLLMLEVGLSISLQ